MLQSFKYEFLRIIRTRDMIFWSIAFPVLLGTFMHMAFSGLGEFQGFEPIPVAVVVEAQDSGMGEAFGEILEVLANGEEAILAPSQMTMEEAVLQLDEGEIAGIYIVKEDEVSLKLANQGMRQSILMMITDRFIQFQSTIETIAQEEVTLVPEAIENMMLELNINQQSEIGRGALDFAEYNIMIFLVLTIFMGANHGLKKSLEFQANRSPLAARRSVSPTKKIKGLIPQLIASVIMQTVYGTVGLAYFMFVLGLDFGTDIHLVILALLVGSTTAISMGMLIGAVVRKGDLTGLEGILTGVTVALCFLAGMMGADFRLMVRNAVPILDRINPATMLADALYSLSSFDDYRIYITSLVSLAITTVIFLIFSAILLRRKNYDSI